MSKAEELFVKRVNGFFGEERFWLRKMPDYKQTGVKSGRGLPDFLLVFQGTHYWLEVKYTTGKGGFAVSGFTDAQLVEFKKLMDNGVRVYIVVFNRSFEAFWITFSDVYDRMRVGEKKVPFKDLSPLNELLRLL